MCAAAHTGATCKSSQSLGHQTELVDLESLGISMAMTGGDYLEVKGRSQKVAKKEWLCGFSPEESLEEKMQHL